MINEPLLENNLNFNSTDEIEIRWGKTGPMHYKATKEQVDCVINIAIGGFFGYYAVITKVAITGMLAGGFAACKGCIDAFSH